MLFPILSGWICYAEKTLGSYVLPYISSVKSPQQSIGAIIKHHLCKKLGLRSASLLILFHALVFEFMQNSKMPILHPTIVKYCKSA